MIHITLLEMNADSESPMIGTLPNVSAAFKDNVLFRVNTALSEHFDIEDITGQEKLIEAIEYIESGSPYEDRVIFIDGSEYEIRVLQTWKY